MTRIFIKDEAGALRTVEVFEGNILNLATGEVESSNFVAYMWLDNGPAHDAERFCVEVNPGMTIMELKHLIEERKGIPCGQQTLKYNGRELEMKKTLMHYGMGDGSVHIYLCVRDLLNTPSSETGSDSS